VLLFPKPNQSSWGLWTPGSPLRGAPGRQHLRGVRRALWKAISILEPELRDARVDFAKTYDNTLVERALAKYRAPLKE
jgi:hypothetical protein